MVEVDIFWSYGIGAGFGFASSRLARTRDFKKETFEGTHFRNTVLYLALAFAPSGIALVWGFPSWETMHLGTRDMPHWLVALFAATNVSQGVLGFALARWLAHTGRAYAGFLQWVLGYFLMFFILVHGWDGSGYQRFFSPTPEALVGWNWNTALGWLTSDVAKTLEVEGIFVVPPILWWMASWLAQGQGAVKHSKAFLMASVLGWSLLGFPALAVVASVLIRELGWIAGTLAFAAVAWGVALRRGGVLHRYFESITEGPARDRTAPSDWAPTPIPAGRS